MGKEFVCKINGRPFLTHEEAVEYLSANYLKRIEKPTSSYEIKASLESHFPGFIIESSEDASLLNELRLSINPNNFSSEDKVTYCLLTSTNINATIGFAISSTYEEDYNEELRVFHSISEMEEHMIRFIKSINSFSKRLLLFANEHHLEVTDVYVKKIELDNYKDYYEVNHLLSVEYYATFQNGTQKFFTHVPIDFEDLQEEYVVEELFQRHVQSLAGTYITFAEGEVEELEIDRGDHYQKSFTINGVDFEDLAKRAKRMRVTIIE